MFTQRTRCFYTYVWLVLGLSMVLSLFESPEEVRAQSPPDSCAREIKAAQDAYINHRFERAIALTSRCINRQDVPEESLIDAYRLKSLSYFRQNALVDAQATINEILAIDPSYEADPINDPPSYALFVSMVREGTAPQQQEESEWTSRARQVSGAQPAEVSALGPTLVMGSGMVNENALTSKITRPETKERETVGVYGLRLTYRNQGVERVHGLNVTMWRPRVSPGFQGGVNGIALGIPVAGGRHLNGLGVGVFGVEGRSSFSGIGIGGLGVTAGRYHGLALSGLGLTVREHFAGVGISGFVVGGSGSVWGVTFGGLGHAVGGSVSGIQVGSVGIGAGESIQGGSFGGVGILSREGNVYGVQVGGLGIGAGGDIGGLTIGGLGAFSGEDLFGISLAGLFLRAGDKIQGVQVTSIGMVASQIHGIAAAGVLVSNQSAGLIVAPGYHHSGPDGSFSGLSISAFNHVRGEQRGLTIGLFNYAQSLQGVQLGLLNYAGNNPLALRLLPGVNLNF